MFLDEHKEFLEHIEHEEQHCCVDLTLIRGKHVNDSNESLESIEPFDANDSNDSLESNVFLTFSKTPKCPRSSYERLLRYTEFIFKI
jgi:hypothetical protein